MRGELGALGCLGRTNELNQMEHSLVAACRIFPPCPEVFSGTVRTVGWVEQEFLDRIAMRDHAPLLWNKMRDAIGCAVTEFNKRVEHAAFSHTDCTSNGEMCRRIETKGDPSWIEVFLDVKASCLKAQLPPSLIVEVCRVRANTRTGHPEFWYEDHAISEEKACELAIRDFLFRVPPRYSAIRVFEA